MIDTIIKCDVCKNIIMGSKQMYYNDNNIYRTSVTATHLMNRIKDGFNYNLLVRFDTSKWQPNVSIDPKDVSTFNGFLLCEDCIEKLEKFLLTNGEG